jgi:hypothetical protein
MTATTLAGPSRLRQVATAAAFVAGIALLTKVGLIVATANTISPTPMAVLYLLGVLAPLVAAAGISAGRDGLPKQIGIYLAVVVSHLLFIVALSEGLEALVTVFTDEVYLGEEIPLAVLGLIWLLVGARMRANDHD